MSEPQGVDWCDITVEDAKQLVEFYQHVLGWKAEPVDMGDYDDYVMIDPTGRVVGGICHKRGSNGDMPGGWIPYFTVADLDAALASAEQNGGTAVGKVRSAGAGRFCVMRDPAGHLSALYQAQ